MLVSIDPSDRRPIGFIAPSKVYGTYDVYQGFYYPTLLGTVPSPIGSDAAKLAEEKFPNVNFNATRRCGFCGGPTPCTRKD